MNDAPLSPGEELAKLVREQFEGNKKPATIEMMVEMYELFGFVLEALLSQVASSTKLADPAATTSEKTNALQETLAVNQIFLGRLSASLIKLHNRLEDANE